MVQRFESCIAGDEPGEHMLNWTMPSPRKTLSRVRGTPGTRLTADALDDPLTDAVNATRRIIEALARTTSSDRRIESIACEMDRIATSLEGCSQPIHARLQQMWSGEGIARHDPATGVENPLSPPLSLTAVADGWVEGTLRLGLPYQGPPGAVHGGVCALLLDAALAVANNRAGANGVTAELDVRYLRPTPLYTTLTVRAKQLRRDGRKRFSIGEIRVNGEVSVTAAGIFIAREHPA